VAPFDWGYGTSNRGTLFLFGVDPYMFRGAYYVNNNAPYIFFIDFLKYL